MADYSPPERKIRGMSVFFMPVFALIGLIGTPIYIYYYGITWPEIALFLFFFITTGMAITAGYHRQFSHVTYKAHPVVRFLLLFFGAATFQKSALRWASQHRQHHQFTDTDLDPHNSKRGVFFCHIGWIMFYKHNVNFHNVKDLQESKMVMSQHEHYDWWSVPAGLLFPMAIGTWMGYPLSTFIITICLRITIVLNAAFLINSYAHMIGTKDFDKNASARDHWLGAVLTNGEGYHSFHHKFPNDYRNGHKWHHWDPTKWFIYLLTRVGLASDLKRTPDSMIEAALKANR